jgi:hypothetical protein
MLLLAGQKQILFWGGIVVNACIRENAYQLRALIALGILQHCALGRLMGTVLNVML